jgi:hypothetical protein
VREAALDHFAAFNAHDTQRLRAGLHPDVVWVTGGAAAHGRDAVAAIFDAGLWALDPHLAVRHLVADTTTVAAELTETITIEGVRSTYPIAVFLGFEDGLIRSATVYREGSAEL